MLDVVLNQINNVEVEPLIQIDSTWINPWSADA